MTADEARGRVGEIRAELRRAMRALSKPDTDWYEASDAAGRCADMCANLECRFFIEGFTGGGASDGY